MTEENDLNARLERAKARLAAIEEAKNEAATPTLQDKVEKAERDAENAEAIAAAEAKYGGAKRIAVIETPRGIVIVRTPHHTHYARFRDKGAAKTEDMMKLALVSLAYPSVSAFEAIVEDYPGTLDRVADRAVHLAGFRTAELSEK